MKRRVRDKHGLKTKSHFFKSLDLQDVTTAEEAGDGAFTGTRAARHTATQHWPWPCCWQDATCKMLTVTVTRSSSDS
jgi:hypothetical protein